MLALAVASAGCGGGESGDRAAVRTYIERVHRIQQHDAAVVTSAARTYAQLARGRLHGTISTAKLIAAADALHAARRRVAALPAPAPAQTLRTTLLAVYDRETALAEEVLALERYAPAVRRVMAGLPGLGQRLHRTLGAATTPPAQAAALDEYASSLSPLEARMRRLAPPRVLVSAYRGELLRLHDSRGLAQRLRAAVLRRDSAEVARLLVAFDRLNSAAAVDTDLQRAAVRAYNRRVQSVSRATAALHSEEGRLNRTLG